MAVDFSTSSEALVVQTPSQLTVGRIANNILRPSANPCFFCIQDWRRSKKHSYSLQQHQFQRRKRLQFIYRCIHSTLGWYLPCQSRDFAAKYSWRIQNVSGSFGQNISVCHFLSRYFQFLPHLVCRRGL